MSNGNTAAASGGIGIFGMMFIALFVGKIFEIGAVGSWSWWLITAPLWGPGALVLAMVVFLFSISFFFRAILSLFK